MSEVMVRFECSVDDEDAFEVVQEAFEGGSVGFAIKEAGEECRVVLTPNQVRLLRVHLNDLLEVE